MGAKINRPNFLRLNSLTFSFNMTDHLNVRTPVDDILTAICQKISTYHQLDFPNWTRLQGHFRIIRITPENELYQYLNDNSRLHFVNWLIFSRIDDQIIVVHFGPFGKVKDKDFEEKVAQTHLEQEKLKDTWLKVRSSSMPESQKETEEKAIRDKILNDCWSLKRAFEEQIGVKKRELIEVVKTLCSSSEEGRERIAQQIEMITVKSGWVVVRQVLIALKEEITAKIAKVVAKMAVKQGAKAASKGAAKTTAKAIPFVGLLVGAGFGIWRLVNGDVAGAGLEIASGAASCVPGAGTVASLAIDTSLAVKDVENAIDLAQENKEEVEALKVVFDRIQGELFDLFIKYETAKAEHDFVCEVLGDPGYNFEKLEHDIGVVDEVLRELHNN